MAKFQAPKGFRGNLHTRKGVVFRRKNFANPILQPLIGPQEQTNGDRRRKKNGGFEETDWFIRNFTSQLLDPHKK